MMKRSRDGEADHDISAMANCLMLLSSTANGGGGGGDPSRIFSCKTCNKQFASFQALGGHRASHKKPRLVAGDLLPPSSPPKPKIHECSICGLEFPIGQALGGHMRRHRAAAVDQKHQLPPPSPPLSLFPVVKKPNNRRVLCLDLNYTPLENKFFLIASSQI